MRHRLPSLSALRAFEAAARNESMTLAGEELSVSPGAISRHVSLLEAHFDCRLFHRRQHGLELTEKGRHFHAELTAAFDRIDTACEDMLGTSDTTVLRAVIYTTFASEWLLPRLSSFRKHCPGIELSLEASWRKISFESDAIDIGVMTGEMETNNIHHDRLFSALYFPVCSPDLIKNGAPLKTPADLKQHTLLHSGVQIPNWHAWLAAAGVPEIDLDRGLAFENSSLAFKAAREGAGVALGQQFFLTEDLVSGRLIVPFNLSLQSPRSYYLVCPEKRMGEPHIEAFREWFLAEVATSDERSRTQLPHLLENVVETSSK